MIMTVTVTVTVPDAVFVTVILTVAVTLTSPIHHRDREPGRERDRDINVTLIVTSWRYQGHGDVTNISIHQTSFQNYFIWNGKIKNKVTDRLCNVLTNGHSNSNGHSNGNGEPWKSWLRLLGDLTFPKKMLFGTSLHVTLKSHLYHVTSRNVTLVYFHCIKAFDCILILLSLKKNMNQNLGMDQLFLKMYQ